MSVASVDVSFSALATQLRRFPSQSAADFFGVRYKTTSLGWFVCHAHFGLVRRSTSQVPGSWRVNLPLFGNSSRLNPLTLAGSATARFYGLQTAYTAPR